MHRHPNDLFRYLTEDELLVLQKEVFITICIIGGAFICIFGLLCIILADVLTVGDCTRWVWRHVRQIARMCRLRRNVLVPGGNVIGI